MDAKERGVDVQVALDRNIAWTEDNNLGFWNSAGKNEKAYRYLREKGVKAYFDDEAVFTHAKALVADQKTVILGSTNWSEAALTRNVEANVLIRSKAFAEEILKGFETLKLYAPEIGNSETVVVPLAFLNSKQLLGRMVAAHDDRSFDTYLFLLKVLGKKGEGKEEIAGYEALKELLGIRGENEWNNGRAVRRVLKRLQDNYGLVTLSYKRGEEPVVSLKAIEDRTGPGLASGAQVVEIPVTYWEWGWNKELSFPGRVMYVLGTMYSSASRTAPTWFRSGDDLVKRHGFARMFLQDGFMDLRRHNLVEVRPDRLKPGNYSGRKANRYAPNPLYDPRELKRRFTELKERYGKKKVQKAAGYASLVYEDSDVEAVERLILLEEEFGAEVVQRAARVVGKMHGSNPKKTVGYLIATIQGIGTREGRKVPLPSRN